MKQANRYHGHRFPPEVISTAVWLYHRFSLSFRDVEELLAQRGVTVSYESIRRWCLKFGPMYQRTLKRRESKGSDRWHVDEVFIKVNGEQFYLWRAVDQDGDVLDILVQRRRNRVAAERFFRKVLERQGRAPRVVVTDRLKSYPSAVNNVLPGSRHDTRCYANNRSENSHQATRRKERQIQRFKSAEQAQCFLSLHARVNNLFRYGRHLVRAENHRLLRNRAFSTWSEITCV
ncbi:MAG: IS6 family transposase [Burkholderiaceae bacterium]